MKSSIVINITVLVCMHLTVVAQTLPVAGAMPVAAAKTPANLKTVVIVQGKISDYKTSTSDRAPHSFTLTDKSDKMRVAVWNDAWKQIAFRDKLTVSGTEITARVKISEFRGQMEGHLLDAADVKEGLVSMPLVEMVNWHLDLTAAMRIAAANKSSILVFFSAADAENSRYLEDKVFTDSRVRRAMSGRFVPVKIDVAAQPEMARKLGIIRGGVVCLYQSNGTPLINAPLASIRMPEDLLKAIQ